MQAVKSFAGFSLNNLEIDGFVPVLSLEAMRVKMTPQWNILTLETETGMETVSKNQPFFCSEVLHYCPELFIALFFACVVLDSLSLEVEGKV